MQQPIVRSDLAQPPNYPDAQTSARNFFFIHGYSVRELQARGWHAELFKRLHQLGSRAKFFGVTWAGDSSKFPDPLPCAGGSAPDYHINVAAAFHTAPYLAQTLNAIPGRHFLAAHSLGNMVASAALRPAPEAPFPPLRVEQYFMMNAAVPLEAYDEGLAGSATQRNAMRHPHWALYEQRLWSSEWHQLFPVGDGRRTLTWRGRFGILPQAVNFYSSTEEVLQNASGVVPPTGCAGDLAWANQEMKKGGGVFRLLSVFWFFTSRSHGGWGFSPAYDVEEVFQGPFGPETRRVPRPPSDTSTITPAELRTAPSSGSWNQRPSTIRSKVPPSRSRIGALSSRRRSRLSRLPRGRIP